VKESKGSAYFEPAADRIQILGEAGGIKIQDQANRHRDFRQAQHLLGMVPTEKTQVTTDTEEHLEVG
jgi:hypothetical protein